MMIVQKHGLSIGIERIDQELYLSMKAVGKLTHEDYEAITPIIDSAIVEINNQVVNILFDATELEGWDLHAAWDDLKFGLKHRKEFNKIAIYGHKKWQSYMAKIGSWFISGEVKCFHNIQDAVAWLKK